MLITLETNKNLQEVRQKLEEVAKSKGFGVMAVHEVSNILQNKGVPINYSCVIVEVCSPKHASQVLSVDPYFSTAMPCRIALFEKDGKTVITTMSPIAMISIFNKPEVSNVAEEVERLMKEIIEESIRA